MRASSIAAALLLAGCAQAPLPGPHGAALFSRLRCPPDTTPRDDIWLECHDAEGKMHGPWAAWGVSGQPIAVGYYEHGRRRGAWRSFAGGRLESREIFSTDGRRMRKETWHPSGALRSVLSFQDGELTKLSEWDEQGRVTRRGQRRSDGGLQVATRPSGSGSFWTAVHRQGRTLVWDAGARRWRDCCEANGAPWAAGCADFFTVAVLVKLLAQRSVCGGDGE